MAILRELTAEERKEITPLNSDSILKGFIKQLADYETKAAKSYKPFDSYSARIDFDNYLKTKIANIISTIDETKADNKLDFDLTPYGEMTRFEYRGAQEYKVPSKIMGTTQSMLTGKSHKFVSKIRGNKFSVFVPLDDEEKYEKWLTKTFPEDVKKIELKAASVEKEDTFEKVEVKEEQPKSSKK